MNPLTLLVWGPGLVWLLRRPAWRWLGLTYLIFLALMMALHAKDYYVAPIYPFLFAAGGLAWESRRRPDAPTRTFAFPILEGVLLLTGLLLLPMSNPILTPPQWIAYANALHLRKAETEKYESGPLPQFYADRFGWQEEVDQIQHAYDALSPADKARVTIYCSNYGEAGAINFLGHNLPQAISGQNTYWLWGPNGATGDLVLSVNGGTPEEMRENYDQVEIVGRMDHPYAMPFEHRNIYLLHHRKKNLTQDWADFKDYI